MNHRLFLTAALLFFLRGMANAEDGSPSFATPNFYSFSPPDAAAFSDYRPVLNADVTAVIFERTFTDNLNFTQLYIANLTTSPAQVQPFVSISSLRPDWCWYRSSKRSLQVGPVAFSNDDGVYVVIGTNITLLPKTSGMVYPSWYPDCGSIAVDVGQNEQVAGEHLSAQIDATTGLVVAAPLANDLVWAGFPSVNQVDPNRVAFAGQFIGASSYSDRSRNPPVVAPMDRNAPAGSGFLEQFQARAGWWSPDAKWFAFESNRSCDNIDGLTYAIFIQDAKGERPAMQVTSCEWNANHPKWFPPGSIVRLRAYSQRGQGAGNPKVEAFSEVVDTGLRRAGFPEE